MTILYCDCFSGISGDMFLGALLDTGLPVDYLHDRFQCLALPEYHSVTVQKVHRGALQASLVTLEVDEPAGSAGRGFNDIARLIFDSRLDSRTQHTTLEIFQKLAEAEAKAHGCALDDVHFHEVGAVDSILDIVGAAVGLQFFDIEALYASALPLGSGRVKTQHGILPLPAPATLELLRMANAPLTPSEAQVELVTPTGAAILAALASFRQPEMRIQRVGLGAGQRELAWPNILRVLIGRPEVTPGEHLEIETNIDDMNPQIYGQVMALLFEAGALDVFFTPIYMKKNRPGVRLSIIARREDEHKLCEIMLRETSTLGVRIRPVWRCEASRETRKIQTPYGEAEVKVKILDDKIIQATPEFDTCLRLAQENGIPAARVLQEVAALGLKLLQA